MRRSTLQRLVPVLLGCLLTNAVLASGRRSVSNVPRTDAHPGETNPASAPAFTLSDGDDHHRSLAEFRGRPVALFFFCGCPWCARCAETWGKFQHGGVLSAGSTTSTAPITLVVFSGDAAAARAFATQAGMDLSQTVLLPDPTMRVTLDLYHAEPCPRVFVLDSKGLVRYTNNHKDDAPRTASALALCSRALDALRTCSLPAQAPDLPSHKERRTRVKSQAPVPVTTSDSHGSAGPEIALHAGPPSARSLKIARPRKELSP